MSVLANARLLVGRKIVAVDLRPFRDEGVDGKLIKITYDPILTLDNGARVFFNVDEIDCGDGYGIRPLYVAKAKP